MAEKSKLNALLCGRGAPMEQIERQYLLFRSMNRKCFGSADCASMAPASSTSGGCWRPLWRFCFELRQLHRVPIVDALSVDMRGRRAPIHPFRLELAQAHTYTHSSTHSETITWHAIRLVSGTQMRNDLRPLGAAQASASQFPAAQLQVFRCSFR